jgi:hypothetical protein
MLVASRLRRKVWQTGQRAAHPGYPPAAGRGTGLPATTAGRTSRRLT